jgi:hypothetical protein
MSADPLVEGHSLDTQLDDLARSAAKQGHQMEDILHNPASDALSWDWARVPELPSLRDVRIQRPANRLTMAGKT